MPKKKKTLKQKKHADERRQVKHESPVLEVSSRNHPSHTAAAAPQGHTFALPTTHTKKHTTVAPMPVSQPATTTISTNEYNYLGKDLLKTGFLTAFIVVAELMIKFFFERG